MCKLLIRYGKMGGLRFLSHLELARALERSFRRAGLPLVMSRGFNPRCKISHGLALPVGVSSESEMAVLDLNDRRPLKEIKRQLEVALPKELAVSKAKYIRGDTPALPVVIKSARYRIQVEADKEIDSAAFEELLRRFLKLDKFSVDHKRGKKWVRVSEAILSAEAEPVRDTDVTLDVCLTVGTPDSVRPDVLAEKLLALSENKMAARFIGAHRVEQYATDREPMIPAFDFFEEEERE